jgi:predicted nucleic acid-binding protein
LLEITYRTRKDFYRQLGILRRKIILVPREEIMPFVKKAIKISPDIGDVPYIALGLKLNIPIWSNDDDLKMKQDAVKVLRTKDVSKFFHD